VDELLPTKTEETGSSMPVTGFRQALRDCEPTLRRGILVDHVAGHVVAAMGLASPHLLDPAMGFFQSGMDSLMSVTLQRALSDSLGESLPTSLVFDYPTVEALSGYLATILPELIEVAEEEAVDDYEDLSDDDLLNALSERLG
jgi:phthiocerol/phenolphthiocerol synthesis type-I polyketide synthase B